MAGAAGVGAGLGIMGGTLGGIGDIIQAANYERPQLEEPGGQEKRLRALAQSQLIGGGQQLLAGQNLYNQMSPFLLGQLPGMRLTPSGGGGAGGGGGGATAGTGPGMANYQQALANYQEAVGRQQRITQLQAAVKTAKKGPDKQGIRQELKTLKKAQRSGPTVTQLERQLYQAGSTPPTINVAAAEPSSDWGTTTMTPSLQSSLAQIMGFIQGARGGGGGGGGGGSVVQSPASSILDRPFTGGSY